MALDNLKIIQLEAENVKRLKAVQITPSGELVEIVGKNGHGKTSVLDSILWALGGEKPIQFKPIREGEEHAFVRLDLGNDHGLQLRVLRRFTAQEDGTFTTSLKVEDADGMRPRGEQTLLNSIVGSLSFDPSAFVRAKDDEQVRLLKSLIPGVDFDDIARRRKVAYDTRTDVNREEKRLRSQGAAFTIEEGTPDEPVDTSEILEKIRNAGAAATEYHAEVARRDRLSRTVESINEEIEDYRQSITDLEQRIMSLRTSIGESQKRYDEVKAQLEALPDLDPPEDTSALSDQLTDLQNINRRVDIKKSRDALIADADSKLKTSENLTKEIEACDAEVVRAIEAADLPVRGLELRDDMVYLRGVPFNQASDAEQLRASMALGMAANPKLRVLRIRDGSLLDEDALEIIREVAEEEQFQIWIERVGSSGGPEAIIMENGEVKA